MANRDTTATPYQLSSDRKCYFAYPTGDAPIPTVADYTELRTKNAAAAGSWGSITVSDPYQKGAFRHAASQPAWGSGSDDGAMTIAASGGGWWVRQFNYGKSYPIELDWYESVVDNFDITALFKQIAQKRTPYFYVRVPSRPMKLVWSDTSTLDWTLTYGVDSFRLYESTAQVEIHIAAPDTIQVWVMSVSDFLVGSHVKKASYLDYMLTFSSTWTPSNRLFHDDPDAGSYHNAFSAFAVTMKQTYPVQGALRCNAGKFQSNFAAIAANQNLTFAIAGRYRYATGVHVEGPGVFTFESPYISDECCRKPGWTGTTAGLLDKTTGLARTGGIGGVVIGASSSTTHVRGEIISQFGGSTGYFFWDFVGNSIDDPLILRIKDFGISGPNEFGLPAGVHMKQDAAYNNHFGKSDGFGRNSRNQTDKRFFKLVVSYDTYGEFSGPASWRGLFFLENNAADDSSSANVCYTKHITFIVVNGGGGLWQQNGPPIEGVEQELDYIHFMGDGVNPAWTTYAVGGTRDQALVVGKYNTLKYARVHNVQILDIGGVIDTVNCTGYMLPFAGCDWTATNLTFSGAARNIIKFTNLGGLGARSFSINNFHAPIGSTITADSGVAATFTLNGVVKTLPYTVQAGDLGTPVPDIPPNPLLGAA